MSFERITNVRLPFDLRHEDPKKNYGIHGLDIWFILKGEKGAVQFAVNFKVYLPHVAEWLSTRPKSLYDFDTITGIDVGYHAREPQYESHKPMHNRDGTIQKCEVLGGPCYYDGSTMRADTWVREIFSISGRRPEDEIWKRLEEEYAERFSVSPELSP